MSKSMWTRVRGALLSIGVLSGLAGPAAAHDGAPADRALAAEIALLRRANQVVWPILTVAAPRCDRLGLSGATIGIAAVSITSFPSERRASARNLLGLGLQPRVLFVPDRTPAHEAGLREGDAVLAVNGATIPEIDDAPGEITRRVKDAIKMDAPIRFDVARDSGRLSATMRPATVCRLAIHATDSPGIEAVFKGDRATVSKGLSQFAAQDRELGLILAHAFAHVILEAEGAGPATIRFNNAGSPEIEHAADKLGLELALAAGFSIEHVAELWERLRDASPAPTRTSLAALHPVTPERLAALRAASPLRASQAAPAPTAPTR